MTLEDMSRFAPPIRLTSLLVATGLAYTWTLSRSGFANTFYAAAAQAGAESWKAWFFGSLDASNAITVDKPPAAIWLMGLSVRLFGLSSWSLLVPEALLGVTCVGLTYAFVRRVSGELPALAAGALTAVTPSAVLMFRFDNPDALLVVLVLGAGYAVLRALEDGRTGWLVLAGGLIGFGFLTKMLQAFLVLPAFGLAYLVLAPTPVRRRLLQLVTAFVAVIVASGWWVAAVALVPASSRPYVDGTTNDSVVQLVLGYNGFGRLTGHETGGLGNAGFSAAAGPLRMFEGISGGMVGWLLPAALLLLAVGVVRVRGAARGALALSGGALVTTAAVFSFMAGIYHDYYTVALAPWIAITAAIGAAELWRLRARVTLALTAAGSALWAVVLLGQSHRQPYDDLRWPVAVAGAVVALMLLSPRLPRVLVPVLVGAGAVAMLTGPASYSLGTIRSAHRGAIPQAGPLHVRQFTPHGGTLVSGPTHTRPGGGTGTITTAAHHHTGGVQTGADVGPALADLLRDGQTGFRWSAATVGSQNAASYMLRSGARVMAIGGFNGTAPSESLGSFERAVAEGDVHYFLLHGHRFPPTRGEDDRESDAGSIAHWVQGHYRPHPFGTTTVFDLNPEVRAA